MAKLEVLQKAEELADKSRLTKNDAELFGRKIKKLAGK
jgi:hypothetical protein